MTTTLKLNSKLHPLWAQHLKDQSLKEKFNKDVSHYLTVPMVQRLRDILTQKIEALERNKDYDTQAWAYKQAHMNGQLETLDFVISLLGNYKDND